MKNIFLSVIYVLSMTCSFGQDYKFGKVSKEELQEKSYDLDETANAVILYKEQSTYFDLTAWKLVTEIHERVKIYNRDGFEHATKQINLFKTRSANETIGKVKAYTYNLDGGQIVKTELEKNNVFKTEISYNYNEIKFTMPNVKEGSVLEFKYKITSPFVWNIDEFRFQYDIPIKKIVAELKTPDGLNFNQTRKGNILFYGKKSKSYNNTNAINYELNDVPALKDENYVDNIDNYRAGVMFELVSIEIPGVVYKHYSSTWGDVAKTIGNTEDYEKQLDKSKNFDEYLDELLVGKTNPIDKMKTVFKYVKEHIKWNSMDGKYFFYGIKKALKEKKGNVGDINLTLVAMLRYAGINANPVVISTKDNVTPVFPTVDRLNYVIAYAVINEKRYFLDATNEFSDINLLPVKDYNWKGILIDNLNMKWNNIPLGEPEKAVEQYLLNTKLDIDGSIEGTVMSRYTNHNAFKFRERFKNKDLDAFIANKEEALSNIEISDYKVKNTDKYEGFVSESFSFLYEDAALVSGDKIYLNPMMFLKLEENPFKAEEREFPVDFGYPFEDKYSITISLPEGYKTESIPEPILMKIPNNLGSFRFVTNVISNKVQVKVSFEIKKARISTDNYLFLKQFFNEMISKEAEQIVLTKA
ncbi:DUF3857 domain-containing protein [Seonamhaeicola sp. MEBiC1930]|uniref:transglutaminase domain-containing protein n=1 Tax=Seonamhaeicola sp. MEBiC01930 TaxID=2976768 RepID=UPI00324B37A2